MIQEETPCKTPYTEEEVNAIVRQNEELRKKYNDVLEKAEKIYNTDFKPDVAAVLSKYLPMLFPELKEIQNETIKQEIRNFIWQYPDKLPERDRWLAWFDKQDEQSCDNKESNDKFKAKFKPDEWISNGRYVKKIIDINSDWPYYMFQDGSSYRIKEIDTKWHIIPNVDKLKWVDMETKECHCYNCELFDRKNNTCKCPTLCKEPHNTYKGFYTM